MNLFSIDGSIKKYDSPFEIMTEYYTCRLALYEKRKQYLLDTMKNIINLISNKMKFILMVVDDKLIINRRNKNDITKDLEINSFPKLSFNSDNISYDYLLKMEIYDLTMEKILLLQKKMDEKQNEYNSLEKMTSIDIWKEELNNLKNQL